MAAPVRFAVLSLDHWYNALPFIDAFRDLPGARLVAVSHADEGHGAPVARRAGAEFTTDYRELLSRPDIDAVGIFASTDRVGEISIAAAEAGKHIVAIKPMAMNLEEADRVVASVKRAGVLYLPSDASYRLAALPQQLKVWLGEGRIGEPLNVFFAGRASLPIRWQGDGARGWWTDPRRSPGGAWIDHAIYQVDFLRYVLETEFTTAQGLVANQKHRDLDGLEDYGLATFYTQRGTVVTIEDTWTQPGFGLQQLYQIIGTEGAVMVDTAAQQMRVTGRFDPFPNQWLTLSPNLSRTSLARHLKECLQTGTQTVAGVEDARTNLAVCLGFYAAARERRTVKLR
jgi:predicted dehydrogenase